MKFLCIIFKKVFSRYNIYLKKSVLWKFLFKANISGVLCFVREIEYRKYATIFHPRREIPHGKYDLEFSINYPTLLSRYSQLSTEQQWRQAPESILTCQLINLTICQYRYIPTLLKFPLHFYFFFTADRPLFSCQRNMRVLTYQLNTPVRNSSRKSQ